MVFAVTDTSPNIKGFEFPTPPFVLINASGLVGRKVAQTDSYVEMIGRLTELGYQVVLVPHVLADTEDPPALREIWQKLTDAQKERTQLIEDELSPAQVRALASRAAFVVTGRMHLSVMALRMGTPAVVIGTQGKVEGMLERFDLADLAIRPEDIPSRLADLAVDTHDRLDRLRSQLALRIDAVVELSQRNFAGLRMEGRGE